MISCVIMNKINLHYYSGQDIINDTLSKNQAMAKLNV